MIQMSSSEPAARPPASAAFTRLLLGLTIIMALAIRVYQVGETPAGLFCDEAALGYNAFAIGSTGYDESGKFLPLYIRSFFGFKNPIYIYAAVLPIRLLGLSEMSLRLTSALFGTLTVLGIYLLAREIWGRAAGVTAAFILAITPWHHHFSRIAFELISFPCLFIFGLYFLLCAVRRGGLNWLWAAILMGFTLYTYAIAFVFLPPFLAVFGLLYYREILARPKPAMGACVVFLAIVGYATWIRSTVASDSSYFAHNTWLYNPGSYLEKAKYFGYLWRLFFSYDFLFGRGDHMMRHASPGFGELHDSFIPLLALGAIGLLTRPWRPHILIVCWILLFPLGASLMNEVPSATRSFIGSPLAALLCARAVALLFDLTMRIRAASLARMLRSAIGAIVLVAPGYETYLYLENYFHSYRIKSAPFFQYGYREMLNYMDDHRSEYDAVYQTALDVNQPYIFELFYLRTPPEDGVQVHSQRKIKEYVAHDYAGYPGSQRMLYALRPRELIFFDRYKIKHEVMGLNGEVLFSIVEVDGRKRFLNDWSLLGLFRWQDPMTILEIPGSTTVEPDRSFAGLGDVRWQKLAVPHEFALLNLNNQFRQADPKNPGNPENVCARLTTYIDLEQDLDPVLEVFGSDDHILVWLNGEVVYGPANLGRMIVSKLDLDWRKGWNELSITTCEGSGDWILAARLADRDGQDLEPGAYESSATPPPSA